MSPSKDGSEDQARRPRSRSTARFPKGGPTKAQLKQYRAALIELGEEIRRSSKTLATEALKGSGQDFSVDNMADHGTDNFEQDVSLSLLEGESGLFRAIQRALAKIDGLGGLPYGLCERCAEDWHDPEAERLESPWIPAGRLTAVPYAHLCVPHQEREEQGNA